MSLPGYDDKHGGHPRSEFFLNVTTDAIKKRLKKSSENFEGIQEPRWASNSLYTPLPIALPAPIIKISTGCHDPLAIIYFNTLFQSIKYY